MAYVNLIKPSANANFIKNQCRCVWTIFLITSLITDTEYSQYTVDGAVAQMLEVLGEGESSVLVHIAKHMRISSPKMCIHPTEQLYFQIMLCPA